MAVVKTEAIAPQASYGVNGIGFIWGALSFNEWMMAATLVLGVLTFATNFYFHYRRNKREKRRAAEDSDLHALKIQAVKASVKTQHSDPDSERPPQE